MFHDRTLREMARSLPTNQVDFLAVPGAGPAKWERYGEHVLGTIARALEGRSQAH